MKVPSTGFPKRARPGHLRVKLLFAVKVVNRLTYQLLVPLVARAIFIISSKGPVIRGVK
jgi:hypothetical protein